MKHDWGYSYTEQFVILADDLDAFSIAAVVGGVSDQAIFLCENNLDLDGCLGAEPRSVGIVFVEGLCDSRGSCQQMGYRWCRQEVPPFNYTLKFAIQLMKSTESLSQGSRH
jgi:hypothetical protein